MAKVVWDIYRGQLKRKYTSRGGLSFTFENGE